MRITIVNLNLDPGELQGCTRLRQALADLAGSEVATIVHFRDLQPRLDVAADGLLLGPQGTPFSAYDRDFLPWLRMLAERARVPVLGVCGGMQALALAYGGRLESTHGEVIGQDYQGLRKVRGPLEVTLDVGALPGWLPDRARQRLLGWKSLGQRTFQSHVEQVAVLKEPLVALARSVPTPIEAFAHRTLPILASQFHPELGWDDGCAAGKAWLEAWLAVVQAH
jgi:GMP synthase-like glutamine amidotransferase